MTFEFFQKQNLAFNACNPKEHFHFAMDINPAGIKKYFFCKRNIKEFLQWYESYNPEKLFFYESLYCENPMYEYYDIDFETESPDPKAVFNNFQRIRNQFLSFYKGVESEVSTDWRITDSTKPDKVSLHLVNRNVVFANHAEIKKYIETFVEYLNFHYPNEKLPFDDSVYNRNKCMRIINSSKGGQNRPLLPAKWHTESVRAPKEDFFIQNVDYCILQEQTGKRQSLTQLSKIQEKEEEHQENKRISTEKNLEDTEIIDEDDDTVENLICLISESVSEGKHTLCDKEHKNKLSYQNFRNLCFAYISTQKERNIEREDVFCFYETDIYPLYRHADDHSSENIFKCLYDSNTTQKSYTINSLHYWARQNPKYKQYFKPAQSAYNKFSEKELEYTLSGSHYDLAEIFHKAYYKEYRITDQKTISCFIWNVEKKLWLERGKESLYKMVSDKLTPIYIQYASSIFKKMLECKDKAEEVKYAEKIKACRKLILHLRGIPFISCVCKSLSGHEIDRDFESKIMNKTTNELPIKNNKIINLQTLEIRNREITDYWSFECPVEFLGDEADLSCVEKFFNDICCGSRELINYHRRLWGYMLTGEISDRSLHIFWGNGCNGKSSVVNIVKNIMGKFSSSLAEDITLKKNQKGATPELMSLLNARFGILPESDKKEQLNSKRIKTITGDDTIIGRHLFGNYLEFKTQCKLTWATNHKPKIDIEDQAILDRLKLIPFAARFPNTMENTAYIKDLQENKLNEFFTWFCFGARDWYSGEQLLPTTEMKDHMNQYIQENDITFEFIEDTYEIIREIDYTNMVPGDKKLCRTSKTEIYTDFICWLSDNNRKDEQIGRKEFYNLFSKKVTEVKTNGIRYFLCKKHYGDINVCQEADSVTICQGPPL